MGTSNTYTSPHFQRRFYDESFKGNPSCRRADATLTLSDVSWDSAYCENVAGIISSRVARGECLLSVGEGQGHLAASLINRELSVYAVDISELNTRQAVRRGISQVAADATRLPFGSNSFDVVLFNESIGAMPLSLVLAEATRVLKPNGRLLVTLPAACIDRPEITNCVQYSVEELTAALPKGSFQKPFGIELYSRGPEAHADRSLPMLIGVLWELAKIST